MIITTFWDELNSPRPLFYFIANSAKMEIYEYIAKHINKIDRLEKY